MDPGIAGRAKGEIGCAVSIGEVKGIAHVHRAVVAGSGSGAFKCAALSVEFCSIALGGKGPFTLHIGHEAHFVQAVSVVKTWHCHALVCALELGA